MKCMLLLIAAVTLAGCEVQPPYDPTHALVTPNGNQGYSIRCGDETECYQWAGYRCPAGYTILTDANYTSHTWSFSRFGGGGRTTHTQAMVVECKGSTIIRNPRPDDRIE